MVVDVSYNQMTIGEAAIDTMRQIDSIMYEAKMSITLEQYTYLQENGVVMESDSEGTMIQKVKEAINKMVHTVIDFFIGIKQKIDAAVDFAKDKVAARKAVKILKDNLQEDVDELKEEAEEAKNEAEKAENPDKLKGILIGIKEKCNSVTKKMSNRTKKVNMEVF